MIRKIQSNWFLQRSLLKEFLLAAGAYFLFSPPFAMPLYNKILFFPDKSNYDQLVASELIKLANMGTPRLDVYFPSANGTRLNGWLFKVPAAKRVVLVSHGNGGNMASRLILAQALVKTGASVFLYDYEGYGKSAYTSAEPCPMCYCATRWARIDNIYFAATVYDAAAQGVNFSDEPIYAELSLNYADRRKEMGVNCYQLTEDNSLSAFNHYKRSTAGKY